MVYNQKDERLRLNWYEYLTQKLAAAQRHMLKPICKAYDVALFSPSLSPNSYFTDSRRITVCQKSSLYLFHVICT